MIGYCKRCGVGDEQEGGYCNHCLPSYSLKEEEAVARPSHYLFGDGLEAIDIIKASVPDFSSYCEGNVLKYMLRFRKKGGVQDLEKARTYLEWIIENETSKD